MYILQVKDVHKSYNKTEAIKGVSFSIKEGEIYGLLGPNGAGKSTLIKIIAGIEKQDRGKIVFEEEVTNINKYKKNMGILTQDIAIYPSFTAYENISFFCSLYSYKGRELKRRVERSLEFVGLNDCRNKKAEEFSGGMMRRLHLACAIAHTPKLIIMDEPTVGIDPQSRNHILESVRKLKSEGGSSKYLKNNLIKNNTYIIILKNKIDNIENNIQKIDGVNYVSINGREIKCSYSKDINILQKLVNTIFNNGGVIESIKNELPTLENVFLNLTGKKLRN